MKRGLKRIGKGILLAILVLAALIYAPFWDTAPPDVADLAVVRVEVPPEENAYTFFLQATNSLRRTRTRRGGCRRRWKTWCRTTCPPCRAIRSMAPPSAIPPSGVSSIRSARIWWMTAARTSAIRDGDGQRVFFSNLNGEANS